MSNFSVGNLKTILENIMIVYAVYTFKLRMAADPVARIRLVLTGCQVGCLGEPPKGSYLAAHMRPTLT